MRAMFPSRLRCFLDGPGRPWLAFCLLGLASVIFMCAEMHNGRFACRDFEVYYKAGARVAAGENLYRPEEDGFYEYLYSPVAAIYFAPIARLPLPVAKVVYWQFLTAAVLLGFYLSLSLVHPGFRDGAPKPQNTLLLLAGIILGVHVQRELHLGQVNQLLLVMYLGVAYLFSRNRPVTLAAIWAASIFIKPLALIFVPYFMLKRRYRELAWFAVLVTALFLSPRLFYERTEFWHQYRSQGKTFETEFNQKADVGTPGNHTVSSVLVRYSPMRFLSRTTGMVVALHGVVLALIGVAVLWLIKRGRHLPDGHVLEFAALIALIPLLSSTAYSAFGFVQLAVFLLLFNFHRLGPRARLWTAGGCVLTGGNWYDLWGRRLWHAFDDSSLITIGTLTLCGALWMARRKQVL